MKLSRREFVKIGALSSAALATNPSTLLAQEIKPKVDVWVFKGPDNQALMKKCMETLFANGGFGPNVKKLALKPNAFIDSPPEIAASTHPDVVEGFLKAVVDRGIKDIILPEYCGNATSAKLSERNGIGPLARKYDVKFISTKAANTAFKTITIEKAKSLKTVEVCAELLEADAVVNMPVAKHHSGAKLSMAMKNWMGVIKAPKWWHSNDLPQCIADFCLFMKPTWTIIDATRCMTSDGPRGGPAADMIYPQQIILSKDQVAADVVTAQLFHDNPFSAVKYLALARDMDIGETDVANMNIHRIDC